MALYLIYSIDRPIDAAEPSAAPYSIAWNAARHLRRIAALRGVPFVYQNLDDPTPLPLSKGDVVIGHLWWGVPNAPMNAALDARVDGVRAAVLMPFTPFAAYDHAELCRYFDMAERLFMICGAYWYDRAFLGDEFPQYARYANKAMRIDMAISPHLHPHLKRHWNPPGARRWLLLGHDAPAKGLDYAIRLAAACGAQVGHCGGVTAQTAAALDAIGARRYGGVVFDAAAIDYFANTYDFFVTCGRADANPTTLLEATSWGLLSFCTPQSGYYPDQPFIGLPLDNLPEAVRIMQAWQHMPTDNLRIRQSAQRNAIARHQWRYTLRPVIAYAHDALSPRPQSLLT